MTTTAQCITPRYWLIGPIGAGSMGQVVSAVDRLTGQAVALKQVSLSPDLTPDEIDQELLTLAHEFRVLAGLRHPHIISVLDYGFDADRQPFYTMELLPEARTILATGRDLLLDQHIELLIQALEALAYLHRRGVLHHDLKPANILVADGRLRLLDFGLAVLAQQQRTDDAFGTLQYLAPEVLDGQPYTEAADLYSLGVIAYELLVGRHPIAATQVRMFLHELRTTPPDLSPLAGQPALAQVLGQLLAKTPAERPASIQAIIGALRQAVGQPAATDPTIRESYLQAAAFVGREQELAQLTAALDRARTGQGSAWLIGGESGVGKSRLLHELRTYALVAGWQVLAGQAVAEGGLPFQVWQQVVPHLALVTELSDLEAGILQEITPSLDQLLGRSLPPVPKLSGPAQRERLVLTLVDIFKRQAQPTLLIVEDLQWAQESLAPLKQMVKVLAQLPGIMVVGTYRHDERPDLPQALPGTTVLPVARLSAAEIARLSRAMLGAAGNEPHIISLLTQETEGNTFFIVEVMRALAEEAGDLTEIGQMTLPKEIFTKGMEGLLRRRIQKVPAADQPLLHLAAVAGRELDLQLLACFAEPADLSGWLQRTAETTVLLVQDNQWRFSHDKLRQTILSQLTAAQHRAAHRQVAMAIEQTYPRQATYDAILLEHWRQAGDAAKELRYVIPVAQHLIQIVGNHDQARAILNRGLDLVDPADHQRITILNELAHSYWRQGDYAQGKAAAQQAYTLAQPITDQAGIATSLHHLGIIAQYQGEYTTAHAFQQHSLAIWQTLADQQGISNSLMSLGNTAYYQKNEADARHYYQQSLIIRRTIGDQAGIASNLNNLGMLAYFQGDYTTAHDQLQESLRIKKAIGDRAAIANGLNNLGKIALIQGDYAAARACHSESLVIMQAIGDQQGTASTYTDLGVLSFEEGAYAQAIEELQQALQIKATIHALGEMSQVYGCLALCHVALHMYETALLTVLAYVEQGQTATSPYPWVYVAVAQTLAAPLAEVERATLAPIIAALTSVTYLPATPAAYFEAALAAPPSQYLRLQTLMAYGQWLTQSGRVEAARTHLSEAQAIAESSQLMHKLHYIAGLLGQIPA